MRTLLHILMLSGLTQVAFAQKQMQIPVASPVPIDSSTGLARVQQVIITESATPAELIARAKTWASKTYNSANDVIQQYDPAAGIMVLKGVTFVDYLEMNPLTKNTQKRQLSINHTVTTEAKAGRVRITVDGIQYKGVDEFSLFTVLTDWQPTIGPELIELEREESRLRQKFKMAGAGWAKRNAPAYLYTDRSIDESIYSRITELIGSFKHYITKKEKDW